MLKREGWEDYNSEKAKVTSTHYDTPYDLEERYYEMDTETSNITGHVKDSIVDGNLLVEGDITVKYRIAITISSALLS